MPFSLTKSHCASLESFKQKAQDYDRMSVHRRVKSLGLFEDIVFVVSTILSNVQPVTEGVVSFDLHALDNQDSFVDKVRNVLEYTKKIPNNKSHRSLNISEVRSVIRECAEIKEDRGILDIFSFFC